MDWMKGKRTYVIAALVGVVTVVYQLGMIDGQVYTAVLGMLGAGGLATLRAGMAK